MSLEFKKNENGQENYLELIEDETIRKIVSNFFDPSVSSFVSPKRLKELAIAINEDVEENLIFSLKEHNRTWEMVSNSYNMMNEDQLNSKTHQIFLTIIKESFGKSAVKLLKQRKNLNVFNLSEVHVLHQEIFDNFGESFVNRILNNDLTPQSLIIIKNVLSNKEEMANFKYFYDFYTKNVGNSHVDFEKMIRSYDSYKELISNIRKEGKKLSNDQKETLTDILRDKDNKYSINTVEGLNDFYKTKQKKYIIDKQWAMNSYNHVSKKIGARELANAIFENYFGVKTEKNNEKFSILDRNPYNICKYYDIRDLLRNHVSSELSKDEIEMLEDMYEIYMLIDDADFEDPIDDLKEIAEKYEKKGNKTSLVAASMFDKLPKTFEKEMIDSLLKVDQIKEKVDNKEKGIYEEKNPRTEDGVEVNVPVYVLDGADFAFLSTTNYYRGLSGNDIVGDLATSWFEYENGTSHICCSYANQDKLSNLEFNKLFNGKQVTYLFDDAEIFTMGTIDIYSPETPRVSNIFSSKLTKIMFSSKLAEETANKRYNEVGINRYDYSGEIKYGGKIIPSAILCSGKITNEQLLAAESFTKYCVENGLKPRGWKMPIVVVNKDRYLEIQKMKSEGLISKNSEYFSKKEENVTKEETIKKEEQTNQIQEKEKKTVNVR